MNTIATTIRDQIGNRALFMLGAQNLLATEKGLSFKIRGCRKISHVRVTLDPCDTYTVQFVKCVGTAIKTVAVSYQVYCDGLLQVIEHHTGLATSI